MGPHDRVALVTGATGALGRVVARRLADDGYRLVLAGTDEGRLREAADDLGLGRERWHPAVADLCDAASARAAIAEAAGDAGAIDILVHLVGGWASGGPVTNVDRDALRDQLDQHLWSTLNAVEATVPAMVERGWGRIVAVATPFATNPGPKMAAYAIPKVAQETLLRTLAREVAGSGVTANLVVVTKIDADHDREREREPSPTNTAWATPEEIAATIAWLVSDAAAAVNGARIPLERGG